jgi:hypothetical protein
MLCKCSTVMKPSRSSSRKRPRSRPAPA